MSLCIGTLIASTAVIGAIGLAPTTASGDIPSDTLLAEGGTLAQPIVDQLMNDGASASAPLNLTYFNSNIDQGRSDFAQDLADFDVTELPISATDAATAKANGRSFAYVPFAASPIAIGAVVMCSNDPELLPTTMCPDLQVSVAQLAGLMTSAVPFWSDTSLSAISDGKGITPIGASHVVLPQVLSDPSASTEALIALFDANPAAKTVWDPFVTNLNGASDAPTETWPTSGGIHGGDGQLAQSLVPEDPVTLMPLSDPLTWGLGQLGPLPADWIGAPRNIPTIAIQNNAGAFVSPTVAAATAALSDATFDASTNLVTFQNSTTDTAAYPLMVMSYMVVPTSGLSAAKATALAGFIRFVLGSQGQADVSALGAAPISSAMVNAGLAVANEVAAQGTTYTIAVNGSTSATIASGATATLSESGLPAAATGTISFTSGSTSLCTITLPSTSCTTAATLASGSYGTVTGSYVDGNNDPAVAASNTISLTVSAANSTSTTTTTTTSTTTTTTSGTGSTGGGGATGSSDTGGTSSGDGSGGTLAFTGANVLPLTVLGAAMVVVAGYGRRRFRRRLNE